MAKSHTVNIRIYYKDTDAGGVVYHTRYAEFMEIARTELLRAAGVSVPDMKEEYDVFFPVTSLSLEYKKPAVYDDLLKVKADVTEISKDMFSVGYSITNQFGELLCTGESVNVCVKAGSFSITNMPQEVIAGLR
jgi:acyl-CoA thioester hydrolase